MVRSTVSCPCAAIKTHRELTVHVLRGESFPLPDIDVLNGAGHGWITCFLGSCGDPTPPGARMSGQMKRWGEHW